MSEIGRAKRIIRVEPEPVKLPTPVKAPEPVKIPEKVGA